VNPDPELFALADPDLESVSDPDSDCFNFAKYVLAPDPELFPM
jgi:hypothetical protein